MITLCRPEVTEVTSWVRRRLHTESLFRRLMQVTERRARRQMKSLSVRMSAVGAVLGVVVLLTSMGMNQVRKPASPGGAKAQEQTGDIPPCNGGSAGPSAGRASAQVNPHRHSVTLSWDAAIPASNSPRDAIEGYYVYRSLTSHYYSESDRISESLIRGTRCVDAVVEPGKAYFYVIKAVTEAGKQSGYSIEIKAVIPFP